MGWHPFGSEPTLRPDRPAGTDRPFVRKYCSLMCFEWALEPPLAFASVPELVPETAGCTEAAVIPGTAVWPGLPSPPRPCARTTPTGSAATTATAAIASFDFPLILLSSPALVPSLRLPGDQPRGSAQHQGRNSERSRHNVLYLRRRQALVALLRD